MTPEISAELAEAVETTPSHYEAVYVGIGASAGGLEALKELTGNLAPNSGMCYVICQHMHPKQPSMLRELLSRSTSLPVLEITHDMEPIANTIHITPPGYNLTLKQARFQLAPVSHIGPKPSVDVFFNSLAEEAGEHSVGIILSGTGSDGAHGIRAIKAAGGITIAQDEVSAKYNGMPKSAIDTGLVDLICTPKQIALELIQMADRLRSKRPTLNVLPEKSELDRIFKLLLRQTDCDFSNYKTSTLYRRIHRRMMVHKLEVLEEYIALLAQSSDEIEMLYKDLLISVTQFFRDEEAYQLLRQHLIDLVKRYQNKEGQLRVWVPGCATGEEAYSIAIMIDSVMRQEMIPINFQVFATDIDNDALIHARRAIYTANSVQFVSSDMLEHYFLLKDGAYLVNKNIRERVVFARHDLVRDPPFSKLDLISCRNVLIYFNAVLQKQVISMFHYALNPSGFLFLGKSESVGQLQNLYLSVDKKVRLFRKQGDNSNSKIIDFTRGRTSRRMEQLPDQRHIPSPEAPKTIDQRLEQSAVAHLLPATVVVDTLYNVQHIRGNVSEFLTFPSGSMDTNLLRLVRDELRIDARTLLHKARREGLVRGPRIAVQTATGKKLINLTVMQMPTQPDEEVSLWAVLFNSEDYDTTQTSNLDNSEGVHNMRINELEQELTATREHLQTTIEELETTNEELQSTNEELQSANEELQSANEELETANEELQSTNEELTTINQELQIKSTELTLLNADLENILAALSIPILVLDRNLRVTRFSSAVSGLLEMKYTDVGQSVLNFTGRLEVDDLREKIIQVIDKGIIQQVSVKSGNKSYWLNITPYYIDKRMIEGVLLVFKEYYAVKRVKKIVG